MLTKHCQVGKEQSTKEKRKSSFKVNFFMQDHFCGYFKASFFKSSYHHWKVCQKLKLRPIGSFMNSKLKWSEPCKDDMDCFGKDFWISIVHSSVNSCLSNNAILEKYQTSLKGLLTFWVSIFPFFGSNLLRKKHYQSISFNSLYL